MKTPPASSPAARRRMRAARQVDTEPELALRSELHRRGLRYRLHRRIEGVPRVRPDIVFVTPRVVVFVDGCFWHGCPDHGTDPKANREWWKNKIQKNKERDRRHNVALQAEGWKVVRVWEHEDPVKASDKIERALETRA